VIGHGTKFKVELAPKKQIMLSQSLGSPIAEVVEVISDTEVRIKKEFGGESGKKTSKIRERLQEIKETDNIDGLDFKVLPYVDQGDMYGYVYRRLTEGGSIAIFPEGMHPRIEVIDPHSASINA
jgi:glycerol-3-phosphate O-acyltransferase / dihydroxyacetone phosphate acyltransferase